MDGVKEALLFAVLLLAAVVPAQAQKVQVDYDANADFSQYKTFKYMDTPESSLERADPLLHRRVVELIENKLVAAGASKVHADPDVFVTYHVQTQDLSTFTTSGYGYGYGRGYYRWGWGGGATMTQETRYTEGTLLVDIWDAETEQLVWRGVSTQVMKADPDKKIRQVEKALDKMGKRWDKIQAGKGK